MSKLTLSYSDPDILILKGMLVDSIVLATRPFEAHNRKEDKFQLPEISYEVQLHERFADCDEVTRHLLIAIPHPR